MAKKKQSDEISLPRDLRTAPDHRLKQVLEFFISRPLKELRMRQTINGKQIERVVKKLTSEIVKTSELDRLQLGLGNLRVMECLLQEAVGEKCWGHTAEDIRWDIVRKFGRC